MVQLKKIQETFPFEKYEQMMSEIKSNGQLIEANKETESSISMVSKFQLPLDFGTNLSVVYKIVFKYT